MLSPIRELYNQSPIPKHYSEGSFRQDNESISTFYGSEKKIIFEANLLQVTSPAHIAAAKAKLIGNMVMIGLEMTPSDSPVSFYVPNKLSFKADYLTIDASIDFQVLPEEGKIKCNTLTLTMLSDSKSPEHFAIIQEWANPGADISILELD